MESAEEIIRDIHPNDKEKLSLLFRRNDVPEITRFFHPFPLNDSTANLIASDQGKDAFFGAFLEDEMLGLGMLRGWDEGYDIPSLGLLVDSGYVRNGIGRRLAMYGIREAHRRRSSKLRLTVYASNDPAVTLFRSVGFKETQRAPVVSGSLADERLEMTLDLRQEGRDA